jgi:hypothetical protein
LIYDKPSYRIILGGHTKNEVSISTILASIANSRMIMNVTSKTTGANVSAYSTPSI